MKIFVFGFNPCCLHIFAGRYARSPFPDLPTLVRFTSNGLDNAIFNFEDICLYVLLAYIMDF